VQTDSDLRRKPVSPPVIPEHALNCYRALNGCPCLTEGHEEAITSVVNFLPVVLCEQRPQGLIVPPDQIEPGSVPNDLDQAARLHDVGEHERAIRLFFRD
jgi:hypothetical protein